ncbi:MAG: membrane integrity-associated transporter subunit PqiC [Roseobacter sp.]
MFLVLLAFVLGGCATNSDLFAVTPPVIEDRQRIAYTSLEIRDISLPAYAAADEIARLGPDGAVGSDGSALWADTPDRAISLELVRLLTQITGARVASAPWPLETAPQARLEIRFEALLALPDGRYQARGQYFVSSLERRERAGLFDLTVPYDLEAGPAALARARGQVIADLALLLTRDALQ